MDYHRAPVAVGVVALVVVAALAGCLGAGAPYEGSPPPEQIEQRHVDALRGAGSFTYRARLDANASVAQFSTNVTAAVQYDPASRLVEVNTSQASESRYVPPEGPAYGRVVAGDSVTYRRLDAASIQNVSRYERPPLSNLTRAYDFERAGTATVDGEKTWVYRANATTLNESAVGPVGEAASQLENVHTTIRLYVRSDGLVKRLQYRVDATVMGRDLSLTYRVTYTDVGSTAVTAPDWLDEAKDLAGV